eukprot:maker-scaffold_8-snap-gene-9.26-mRNA-1 protein AED:0.01 eAED:0.01 QI:54/1/1/1/1/1/3/38/540
MNNENKTLNETTPNEPTPVSPYSSFLSSIRGFLDTYSAENPLLQKFSSFFEEEGEIPTKADKVDTETEDQEQESLPQDDGDSGTGFDSIFSALDGADISNLRDFDEVSVVAALEEQFLVSGQRKKSFEKFSGSFRLNRLKAAPNSAAQGLKKRASVLKMPKLPRLGSKQTLLTRKRKVTNETESKMIEEKNKKKFHLDRHFVRRLVSQNRKRFVDKKHGYDLDLAYILPNLIAMGHPSKGFEVIYRNNFKQVLKFLHSHHENRFKIYNLCLKQKYAFIKDVDVEHYGFCDHQTCPLNLLCLLLEDIHHYLKQEENTAVIHCKAGKGRTGLVCSAYLLHSKTFDTAEKAIEYFGQQRTIDGNGLTVPSQRRCVKYYELALGNPALMNIIRQPAEYSKKIFITEIRIVNMPKFLRRENVHLKVYKAFGVAGGGIGVSYKSKSSEFDVLEQGRIVTWKPVDGIMVFVQGDFRLTMFLDQVKLVKLRKLNRKLDKLFQCWLNTNFLTDEITLGKYELDGVVGKDINSKYFEDDFKVEILFQEYL